MGQYVDGKGLHRSEGCGHGSVCTKDTVHVRHKRGGCDDDGTAQPVGVIGMSWKCWL